MTYGIVPPNAFDKMSEEAVSNWLKKEFMDPWAHYCPSSVDIGGPLDWTARAFSTFSPETQQKFAHALLALTEQLLLDRKSWEAPNKEEKHDSGQALIDYIEQLIKKLPDREKFQAKMVELLDKDGLSDWSKLSALGVLIVTRYKAPPDFWLKQHSILNSDLRTIAGLGLYDPAAAFDQLAQTFPNIPQQVRFFLDVVIADIGRTHGREVMEEGLAKLRERWPTHSAELSEIARSAVRSLENGRER